MIDSTVPYPARSWNYWLGGENNYPVDRQAGKQALAVLPEIADIARASRGFLMRAVRHLTAEAGIRQFLDIGSGLPTANNTHEAAQRAVPESRVVYVDEDPLVLVRSRALLTSSPEGATDYIEADARDVDTILAGAAERVIEAVQQWNQLALNPYHLRSPGQIAAFFDGLELIEPGVVPCPRWRPGPHGIGAPRDMDEFCALGRKR